MNNPFALTFSMSQLGTYIYWLLSAGETILPGSPMTCTLYKQRNCLSFQGYFYSESPWKTEVVFLEQKASLLMPRKRKILSTSRSKCKQFWLLSVIKDWGFFSCDTNLLSMQPLPGLLRIVPVGLGEQGGTDANMTLYLK